MHDFFETIKNFMHTGGDVLTVILFATILLWSLIIDRLIFYKNERIALEKTIIKEWFDREDHSSWFAHKIREANLSKFDQQVFAKISTIKTLVSLCPLLGLLGTVTGMIAVFDIMALTGTSNARLMASGISMATIPTMAGMVAALSGVYFGNMLEKKAKKYSKDLSEKLIFE